MINIYQDIAKRTNGDIYVGVVGPVRTGKSTFVTKFMQHLIMPNITDKDVLEQTRDQLPQSSAGKMIMTTQPNFVPNKAVKINFGDNCTARVRLIDCVGYVVDGSEGYMDGEQNRLVLTPWNKSAMPFIEAAELGTNKVITDHSTVAIVVTNDGTITDIARENYVAAEDKVIRQLKAIGKPYIIVVNSKHPNGNDALALSNALSEKYSVTAITMDIATAETEQFEGLIQALLSEFPIRKLSYNLPDWMRTLDKEHPLIANIIAHAKQSAQQVGNIKDVSTLVESFGEIDNISTPTITEVKMGSGEVVIDVQPDEQLFYNVLSEQAGTDITSQFGLMDFVVKSAYATKQYNNISTALNNAMTGGYGIVEPTLGSMMLEAPEIVKQGARYGVKLKATSPSLHIMRVDVSAEVNPIVGTEQQSQYMLAEFESNPEKIWETNMFGKSMSSLVEDAITEKCHVMPDEVKDKLVRTTNRIVNDGKGGLICLLL